VAVAGLSGWYGMDGPGGEPLASSWPGLQRALGRGLEACRSVALGDDKEQQSGPEACDMPEVRSRVTLDRARLFCNLRRLRLLWSR